MNYSAITFDIDWAPDWCIDLCLQICKRYNAPATFFVTHYSEILSDLLKEENVEVGIHPNFLPGSSHGEQSISVLENCLEMVPDAISMRTHSLVQSSPILYLTATRFSQIQTDCSLFLPLHSRLMPTDLYPDGKNRLTRLPYFWEDDVFANWPNWSWSSSEVDKDEGVRIFNFHPIHVALNMARMERYYELRQATEPRPLLTLSETDMDPFINRSYGTRSFLEKILDSESRLSLVSDITEAYRTK